jgi:hypothetical protein
LALCKNESQFFLETLYSAEIFLLAALYSLWDKLSAIAPVLKERAVIAKIAVM